MNRRDLLKLFGVTVASTALAATGAVPAEAHPGLDEPVTPHNPLAHFALGGVAYAVKSFNLRIESNFNHGSSEFIEVDIFDYPSSNAFSALHSLKPLPFSLYLEHEGTKYRFAGDVLLHGIDRVAGLYENTTTFTGKVMNLTTFIDTL